MTAATDRWADELHGWAMPQALLDAAPANPYAFPTGLIATPTVPPRQTPTGQRVLERVEEGGRILDVGCGAGRISGAFSDAFQVVGVEPRPNLAAVARDVGVDVHEGRWPDLAEVVGDADVVLSTHVLYDVDTPTPFLTAMDGAARHRVVIEVSDTHPWSWIIPLFRHFHDLDRPAGPTAELLAEVIAEAVGVNPEVQAWTRPRHRYDDVSAATAHARQMLCLTEDRDAEITAQLEPMMVSHDDGVSLPDQQLATLWWDTDG